MHWKKFLIGVGFTMVALGLCVCLSLLIWNSVVSTVGFTIHI